MVGLLSYPTGIKRSEVLLFMCSGFGFGLSSSDEPFVVCYRSRDCGDDVPLDGFTSFLLVMAEMWPKILFAGSHLRSQLCTC